MKTYESHCLNCNKAYQKRRGSEQHLCKACQKKKEQGTLRQCGNCLHFFEVELGESGYAAENSKGQIVELCSRCEEKYKKVKGIR